jgi:hypothetical protein
VVGIFSESFLVQLVFEVLEDEFLFDDVVDFVFDFFNRWDVAICLQSLKSASLLVEPSKICEVLLLAFSLLLLLGNVLFWKVPKALELLGHRGWVNNLEAAELAAGKGVEYALSIHHLGCLLLLFLN